MHKRKTSVEFRKAEPRVSRRHEVIEELDRLFDLAFVRPPANSYIDCVSTDPDSSKIDVNLAREQHRQYVSILRECGVKVVEMPPLEAFPDSVFMQDPALLGRSHAIMGRFGEAKRRGEEKAFTDELNKSNIDDGQGGLHFTSSHSRRRRHCNYRKWNIRGRIQSNQFCWHQTASIVHI